MKLRAALLFLAACSVPTATRLDGGEGPDGATADAANADAPLDGAPDAALAAASLSGTPASDAAFGDVVLGQTSGTQGYTITNDGDDPSGTIAIAFDDATLGFALMNDTCSGAPLAGHHGCSFGVTFTPVAAGAAASTLRVIATPGGELDRDVGGDGLTPGAIDLVEHGYDFGSQGVDAGAVTHAFDVTNGGDAAIGAPSIGIGGAIDAYFVDSTTCTTTLAPGAHCTIVVRFDPSTVGAKPGSLTVTSSPGGSDAATLSGTGVGHVKVTLAGTGAGTVQSNQPGIDCGATCTADFSSTPVTLTANTAVGSTFAGWSGDCTGTGSCTLDLTGAKNVTATFTAITPVLAVAKSGTGAGTIASSPAGINCGTACSAPFTYAQAVTLSAAPATGSTFGGWAGACSGTGPCAVTMDQARSVSAEFDAVTPVLTVALAGTGTGTVTSKPDGIACGATCSATYPYAQVVTLTALADTGAQLTGWTGACSGASSTCIVTMDQARSVTATFDALTPTLTVALAGTGAGSVASAPAGISCGATCSTSFPYAQVVTLTATAQTGSQFTGWSGACTGASSCTVTMTQAQNVTATFAPFTPTLTVTLAGTGTGTVTSSPAGITCGATCAHSYAFGDSVTLTATVGTGATFTGWTGACTGTGACTVAMTQAQNVTATFDALTPAVTVTLTGTGTGAVTSSPAGIDCGSSCTASFTYGATVTLTATAQTGSTFAGWTGACSGTTSTCTVITDRARAVGAEFDAVTPPLTVAFGGTGGGEVVSAPAGLDCTAGCTVTFPYAAMVTLTATAQTGSQFTGWTGACTGTSPCVVSMTTARSVTATFALQTFTLTTATPGTGTGTIGLSPPGTACGTGCATYPYGTVVVLTESAGTGSSFTGWGGDCSGTQASCTIGLTQDRNVTAAFALKTFSLTIVTQGSGTVTPSPAGTPCGGGCSSYGYGQAVTLTETAQAGSTFSGWSGADAGACAGTANPTCTVTIDQARTITATFALQQFDVSYVLAGSGAGGVSFQPGGASCGAQCATYPFGTAVTLVATPAAGSTFAQWSGSGAGTCAGSSNPSCALTADQARTVTATFTIDQEDLTVVTSGAGSVSLSVAGSSCGTGCSQYAYGTVVTLTASAQTGAIFSSWSGADAGPCAGTSTASCTVTMDRARTITATFGPAPENLTWTYTGLGMGTVAPSPLGTSCGATCATFNYGQMVTLTATPGAGAVFGGWSGGGCSGTGPCAVTMTSAVNVSARFDVAQETLTWSTTGGLGTGTVTPSAGGTSCGPTCATYPYGAVVTIAESPATGSTFNSWSGACTGSTTCSVTMNGAQSITARFDLIPENLTLATSGNGAGSISPSKTGTSCGPTCQAYGYGTVVVLTATPATGSTFTGWSGAGCSGTGTCSVTMTSGQTVTAGFTLQSETLTWGTNGNGAGAVSINPMGTSCGPTCATFNYGDQVKLTAAAITGSSFTGWSGGGCSSANPCTVTIGAATSVTATFTLNKVNLTLATTGTGNGTVSPNPVGTSCGANCYTYNYGDPVTVNQTANAGSGFTGWSGACTGFGTCNLTMIAAVAVTASFTGPQTLTVAKAGSGSGTVTSSPGGINCGGLCSTTFGYAATVSLTATPAAGSTFTGWSGVCVGVGTCNVSLTSAITVTATFQPVQTLTVSLTGNGVGTVTDTSGAINCGSACSATYGYGTTVTLVATPSSSYSTFAGWSGPCSGTGTCVVSMTQAQHVTATFSAVSVAALTLTFSGSGTGTVTANGASCTSSCTIWVGVGIPLTLTASPGAGDVFTGWIYSAACSGTGTCTFTPTNAISLTAEFDLAGVLTVNRASLGSYGTVTFGTAINCGPAGSQCTATLPVNSGFTLTFTGAYCAPGETYKPSFGVTGCTLNGNTCAGIVTASTTVTFGGFQCLP